MKYLRNFILILTLIILSYGSGYTFGSKSKAVTVVKSETIKQTDKSIEKGLDFTLFWDVWDRLNNYYIDKSAINAQKMIYGAISGMVQSLDDPYTVFLNPLQNKEAKDDLGGKFEGIGAQLGVKDKKIVVIAPLKKSPAELAGIHPGDWIIKVDGKETMNWTLPETVAKIRGQRGSKVVLTVIHKDEEKSKDIEVLRDEINVSSVEWELIYADCGGAGENKCEKKESDCPTCKNAYYIKLAKFGDSTNTDWNKVVDEIVNIIEQIDKRKNLGLILDVRNNPGGYLSGSVFIASEFLNDGTVVMQEVSDGTKKTYTVNRAGKLTSIPLVVLINKGSASASEIVAGALRVRKKIKLIGETSFGKGTIQEAQDLAEGAGIHITTAKWLLPDQTNIHGKGLIPDIEIANDINNPDLDKQLLKAIDALY